MHVQTKYQHDDYYIIQCCYSSALALHYYTQFWHNYANLSPSGIFPVISRAGPGQQSWKRTFAKIEVSQARYRHERIWQVGQHRFVQPHDFVKLRKPSFGALEATQIKAQDCVQPQLSPPLVTAARQASEPVLYPLRATAFKQHLGSEENYELFNSEQNKFMPLRIKILEIQKFYFTLYQPIYYYTPL